MISLDQRELFRLTRFAVVGASATISYLALLMFLTEIMQLNVFLSTGIAAVFSMCISYLGHHGFTFQKSGNHRTYIFRYVAVAVVLLISVSFAVFGLAKILNINHLWAASAMAVIYPLSSYVLNKVLVFKDG